MQLTQSEANLIFLIMRDLSGDFDHFEVRQRVGESLLELLNADYFASYVWNESENRFACGVNINMSTDNLARYEAHFQFHDPITPTLQRRRKATPVSQVMRHDRLVKTEFFNDFLKKDGLCYGINYFAWDRGTNIGDIRVWRASRKEDFTQRDAIIVDKIGPSFVNALVRARKYDTQRPALRFSQIGDKIHLTMREIEIADLIVFGASDEGICARLLISKPTLRSHITSIFKKTGLNRRTQFARFLVENSSTARQAKHRSVPAH